ncbi:MAG: glycosyltransferase [Blastocatellia bacterium]|nr:glycosyltransferase [Blastocatellia bacterium]
MRVLHVLDHSLPYFSGYGFRSDYIIRAQQRLGFQPVVVTSPKHENFAAPCETRNGVRYHRLRWPLNAGRAPIVNQAVCMAMLAGAIVDLAGEYRPAVIHAHSPALIGIAAALAARRVGLPWIYEIRYFEEDAAVDRGKLAAGSARYRFLQWLEMAAARRAGAVATIGCAMREDLMARGLDGARIFQRPNGVDTALFAPRAPDRELLARHELAGRTVIGFIGSFYHYEGLENLIEAMRLLLAARRDVRLLLAGEGEAMESLRGRIPEELRTCFIFAGQIPHDEAPRYYSVMDVLVYPRIRSRLTELTTPLKPLEAMSMERAVIGSDLGGIRELFDEGRAGRLVPPGDPRALAEELRRLVDEPETRRALGQEARRFVVREREWETIVRGYEPIYHAAISSRMG